MNRKGVVANLTRADLITLARTQCGPDSPAVKPRDDVARSAWCWLSRAVCVFDCRAGDFESLADNPFQNVGAVFGVLLAYTQNTDVKTAGMALLSAHSVAQLCGGINQIIGTMATLTMQEDEGKRQSLYCGELS